MAEGWCLFVVSVDGKIRGLRREIKVYEDAIGEKNREIRELIKQSVYCDTCNSYYLESGCVIGHKKETVTEITYVDCGYGEDDEIGDVTYFVKYAVCPKCGNHISIARSAVKTENIRPMHG